MMRRRFPIPASLIDDWIQMKSPSRYPGRVFFRLFILAVLVSAAQVPVVSAQGKTAGERRSEPEVIWKHIFPVPGRAIVPSILPLKDGGLVAVGGYRGTKRREKAWGGRFTSGGKVLWQGSIGDRKASAFSVSLHAGGGYLVSGLTRMGHPPKVDGWLARIGGDGSVIWQRTVGGRKADLALSALSLPGGGVVIGGGTESKGPKQGNGWAIALDVKGNPLWEHAYGGDRNDMMFIIIRAPGGGFLLGGATEGELGQSMASLVRMDARGRTLWERTYNPEFTSSINGLSTAPGGGFIVTGGVGVKGARGNRAWVFKIDEKGKILWQSRFGGRGNYLALSPHPRPDGGMTVLGIRHLNGFLPFDGGGMAWVFRLDAKGKMLWERRFMGVKGGLVSAMAILNDGTIAAAGPVQNIKPDKSKIFVMRVNIHPPPPSAPEREKE